MMAEKVSSLCYDPDQFPENTLKAFNEFTQAFELRYRAVYPDPPKVSMDVLIERWKLEHEDAKPNLQQYNQLHEDWQSTDKVIKVLGLYSTQRLYSDWQLAEPSETERTKTGWDTFKTKMRAYYQPTQNLTIKHYQFRQLTQQKNETFSTFAIRVEKEAKHCQFKCTHDDCSSEDVSI